MALEDVLAHLRANGCALNNLFQRPGGLWQANVRNAERVADFGYGDDPEAAVLDALTKLDLQVAASARTVAESRRDLFLRALRGLQDALDRVLGR